MRSIDLYEPCTVCKGAGFNPNKPAFPCIGCGGLKFLKVGLTLGQVERMKADRERLRLALADVLKWAGAAIATGELSTFDDGDGRLLVSFGSFVHQIEAGARQALEGKAT